MQQQSGKNKKKIVLFASLIIVLLTVLLIKRILPPKYSGVSYNEALQEAVSTKDPSVCEQMTEHITYGDYDITNEDSISLCKAEYAILAKDLDYCMTLKKTPDTYEAPSGALIPKGIPQRDVCLKGLAHELRDPELCELLSTATDSEYGETYVEGCKTQALDPNYKPVRESYSVPDFNSL